MGNFPRLRASHKKKIRQLSRPNGTQPAMAISKASTAGKVFEALLEVMASLRGPKGCPWDREQTHRSLTACLLEETYEVLDAIEAGDPKNLREELGDLLLQIVFHSQIAKEGKDFDIKDVVEDLTQKLVRRHPHVFAGEELSHPEEAIQRWEKIKSRERGKDESLLSGVPVELPALLRAYRIGSKTSRVGFDWPDCTGVLEKVEEELKELHEEIREGNQEGSEEEFGDLLFSLAQLARFLKLNPEDSLRKSTLKFQRRFEYIEKQLKGSGREFSQCSSEELDSLWEEAKSYTGFVKNL